MIRTVGKWLVRLIWLVWILAMLLIGVKIALDNTQEVQLTLFSWQAPAFSLGFTVCFALLCGVVVGWLASTGPYFLAQQKARRLEKQLRQSRGEVSTLRTAPLKS